MIKKLKSLLGNTKTSKTYPWAFAYKTSSKMTLKESSFSPCTFHFSLV